MNLVEEFAGLAHKKRMRVGRGIGSGKGKTCGRGHKGAGSRSGYKMRLGNEGGQGPLFKKLPIKGFSNGHNKKEVLAFNLSDIDRMVEEGGRFDLEFLFACSILTNKNRNAQIKILGKGLLKKKIHIEAHAFSRSARDYLDKEQFSYTQIGQE